MPSRRDLLIAAGVAATPAPALAQDAAAACVVSTWDFGAAANAEAFARRRAGGTAVDMVEAGARVPEADPTNHSVGLGGYPDRDGHVTLDAVIMDQSGNVGAVCALEDVVHAVSVARAVMEKTPHTMLVGVGARSFAVDQGFETTSLLTPESEAAWREWLVTADYRPRANSENTDWRWTPGSAGNHDTIGILAIDGEGRLGGACTTSGMAFKMRGRVGDSPLAGAGLWVEPGVGAATATGVGEDVVRIAGSHSVVEAMRAGAAPTDACRQVLERLVRLRGTALAGHQVALLALDVRGRVGGLALLPGFTYAVTDTRGATRIERAGAIFPDPA
ncbi:N(4)-(beta-N-acetylglucosaminyl)-L-asparaginase [Brevundimonas sp. NIBR11]|uniref:N(4)-(beta-N-acetylglucosaminyl)-L-asparaginase n=1 Tax=Brevundimonas sp. NIBR11 TaxID=3015999 RepID=UPI0022F137DE|nr:N(4)-(beta-N-acetylglucosaminyl)-L-asparaginase [Brevundimonas sp. NIBR11]WGM32015.1 N(4)-(Beta-N-acetylglucosaminyl)-L-asparaginase [Brevundimonas sp. NIBR11]